MAYLSKDIDWIQSIVEEGLKYKLFLTNLGIINKALNLHAKYIYQKLEDEASSGISLYVAMVLIKHHIKNKTDFQQVITGKNNGVVLRDNLFPFLKEFFKDVELSKDQGSIIVTNPTY
ncbi:hypothetical protein L2734_16580 [Parashewanella spongiae]|uniref:hypothetical protein n=1 Tax=Parashewanella spongiae TaxID=342950 RepID=UPI001059DFF0|nr:hypothetical protein [Parashewanella spongiae]MCL1079757.1 hypothetical protein [Parashewanella spongiae]